jgi:hypothetical protein
MSRNGTLADESAVLRECLRAIGIGRQQVVASMTRLGRIGPASKEELDQTASYLREGLEGVEEETLADFLAKNRDCHPVAPDLTLDGQLVCVSDEQLQHIFRDNEGWERFRERFPESTGTLDFSRVGFNSDLTQALVYAGVQVDWLMGQGAYGLYTRTEGGWAQSASVMAWIS